MNRNTPIPMSRVEFIEACKKTVTERMIMLNSIALSTNKPEMKIDLGELLCTFYTSCGDCRRADLINTGNPKMLFICERIGREIRVRRYNQDEQFYGRV